MSKLRTIKITCDICGEETIHKGVVSNVNLDALPCDYCLMRQLLRDQVRGIHPGLTPCQIRRLFEEAAEELIENEKHKIDFNQEEEPLKTPKKLPIGGTILARIPPTVKGIEAPRLSNKTYAWDQIAPSTSTIHQESIFSSLKETPKPPTSEEEEARQLRLAIEQSELEHKGTNNNSFGSFPFNSFRRRN